jgi:HAMP domain-containing protein
MEQKDASGVNVQELLWVLTAIRDGNFTRKMEKDQKGAAGEIAAVINSMVDQLNAFAAEMTRITREIGAEGMFGGQAEVAGLSGTWEDLIANLNIMGANLTNQVRNISQVADGLAKGSPSQRVTVEAHGETLELKKLINRLVDQAKAR